MNRWSIFSFSLPQRAHSLEDSSMLKPFLWRLSTVETLQDIKSQQKTSTLGGACPTHPCKGTWVPNPWNIILLVQKRLWQERPMRIGFSHTTFCQIPANKIVSKQTQHGFILGHFKKMQCPPKRDHPRHKTPLPLKAPSRRFKSFEPMVGFVLKTGRKSCILVFVTGTTLLLPQLW